MYKSSKHIYLDNRHHLSLPPSPGWSSARRCLFLPICSIHSGYPCPSKCHNSHICRRYSHNFEALSVQCSSTSAADGDPKSQQMGQEMAIPHKWGKISQNIDFTLQPQPYASTVLDGKTIPLANLARYLGLHLDSKLNWQEHVYEKRDHIEAPLRKYYWLIGYHSQLSLENKSLIYIKPLSNLHRHMAYQSGERPYDPTDKWYNEPRIKYFAL